MICKLAGSANHPLSDETMQQVETWRNFICSSACRMACPAVDDCNRKFARRSLSQPASRWRRTECAAIEFSRLAGTGIDPDEVCSRSPQFKTQWIRLSVLAAIERDTGCRARTRRDYLGGPTPAICQSRRNCAFALSKSRLLWCGLHHKRQLNPSREAAQNPT